MTRVILPEMESRVDLLQALSGYNINPSSPAYTILALTRDSTSGSSTRLASLPGVQVKQVAKNCMDEPAKAFADAGVTKGGVYAVLSVQSYVSPKVDIAQGQCGSTAPRSTGLEAERWTLMRTSRQGDRGRFRRVGSEAIHLCLE
jgi:hypothetical protein